MMLGVVIMWILSNQIEKLNKNLDAYGREMNILLKKVGEDRCREILDELKSEISEREISGLSDETETFDRKNLARKINFTSFI